MGRHGQRTNKAPSRGGYGSRGLGFRPAMERQRTSDESASSSGMAESPDDTNKMLSLEKLKDLNLDNKLETMFSCLLDVKATNDRLLNAERTVKQIRKLHK